MTTLINKDENGIIWINSDTREVFGIVSDGVVLDRDGIECLGCTLANLEIGGVELIQDWENEATYIDLECGGRIEFCNGNVELKAK